MIEHLSSIPNWATGAIGLLVGAMLGHRLAIGRDIRKHRADTFNTLRATILSTRYPVKISAADADALVQACAPFRRRSLSAAIERCNKAAQGYHDHHNELGEGIPSPDSERVMRDAVSDLVDHLRRI